MTGAADLDAARDIAEAALAFRVEGLAEDGEPLSEPSTLETVMEAPGNRDGVAILVPLADGSVRTAWANITLPEDALREIDAYTEAQGFTRLRLLLKAARRAWKGREGGSIRYLSSQIAAAIPIISISSKHR